MSNFVGKIFPFWGSSHYLPVLNLYRVNFQKVAPSEKFKKQFLKSSLLRHAFLIQQLSSNEVKQNIIDFIMKVLPQDSWYRNFVQQLVDQLLSLNDQNTTDKALNSLARYTAQWHMIPEFIKKLENNSKLLSYPQEQALIKIFTNTITPQYKSVVNDSILELYNNKEDLKAQFDLITFVKYIDSEQYKTLLPLFISEKNISKPEALFSIATLIITEGKNAGISQEYAQNAIKKLLPFIEQLAPEKIWRIIQEIVYAGNYLGIEFSKEIILKLFPKIEIEQQRNILTHLNFYKSEWGQDFINQLEAISKTTATQ
jgi:hypothetical protein